MKKREANLSYGIKIYHYGLHRGEERIVVGNSRAGMINFSGCHLRCNFCYTPETSVDKQGTRFSADDFSALLEKLEKAGAQNINLISPTHLWPLLRPALALQGQLPLVLKISGYESPGLIESMAELASVFVPDFKVWGEAAASDVNLPRNYGKVALRALETMMKSHFTVQESNGALKRGILLRHLLMPGFTEDSLQVVAALREVGFAGHLNLMTYFIDPRSHALMSADAATVDRLREACQGAPFRILLNGKLELAHA